MTNNENIKYIPLTQGKFAIVDDADYEWLMQWKWCYNQGYARRGIYNSETKKSKLLHMHREIMNCPNNKQIDHINGQKLDNLRSNLRICTSAENCQNRKRREYQSSKYKGVFWHTKAKKWVSQIKKGNVKVYLGSFDDEIESAKAYDKAAVLYFDQFARINFPIQ